MRKSMTLSLPARATAPGNAQNPVGLLLVALPVLLLGWLIVYPIFSAVITTVFIAQADGTTSVSLASYRFFFSDPYSLANLWVTLWTTVVCGVTSAETVPPSRSIRRRASRRARTLNLPARATCSPVNG